jgi:hypothetical protein
MFEGFTPIEYEKWGGLITWPRGADVPKGWATDLLNCRFLPGAVFSRSEVNAGLNATPGGDTYNLTSANRFNGIVQFIDNLSNKTLIGLDSNGDLRKHAAGNWTTMILQDCAVPGAMMKSVQLFNRIFLAFYRNAGIEPAGPVRDYDGTNIDILAPDGPGGAPTAAVSASVGTVSPGDHKVAVMFETHDGRYLTEPGPEATWTAAGLFSVDFTNIPTGPSWVVARRLIVTAAGGGDFFYLTRFRIPNNTDTTLTVDFDDTVLQQGENYNKYFKNLRLMDCSGVTSYGSRLVTWGGLNTVRMRNLNFDGGFNGGVPLGWAAVAGGQARGTVNPYEGDYFIIEGDGATATVGEINQAEAARFIKENTAYRVNVRARLSTNFFGSPTTKLEIDLFGTGVDTTGLDLLASSMTTEWVEYEGELTAGLAVVPADLVLRVFSSGTMALGLNIEVDRIQIWPSKTKYEASALRISDPGDIRFDGVNGVMQISKDDGQRIIGALEQNSYLYVYKERSGHIVVDDGQNTPNNWRQQKINSSVGLASPNAIDAAKEYHIVAARDGGHRVQGLDSEELTQEIATTWARVNWAASHTIHIQIDEENRLVYFYVPLDGDTEPNHCLLLDFSEGWGEGQRKWNIDKYPTGVRVRSSAKVETSQRKQDIFLGASDLAANTAQIYNYAASVDVGTEAIQSFFETAFGKAREAVAGQDLFGGVAVSVSGNGTLLTTLKGFTGTSEVLASQALSSQVQELAMEAELENDRAKIRFEVNGAGHKFAIHRAILYAMFWATVKPN